VKSRMMRMMRMMRMRRRTMMMMRWRVRVIVGE
jgi:hypothetical protein